MWIFYVFVLSCVCYNAFNVYRRELAPGTVSLTGDRAQGDDSKHWAYSMSLCASVYMCFVVTCWERADLLALIFGV